ncbi:MAG: UPF0280 family protein [Spirochaetia bacterium]
MDEPEDIKRTFRSFSFKGAHYRFSGPGGEFLPRTIRRLRGELERYIHRFPSFGSSLEPFVDTDKLPFEPPEAALRMHRASLEIYRETGGEFSVGPMAAVAGTFAELTIEEVQTAISTSPGEPSHGDTNGRYSEKSPGAGVPVYADIVLSNGGDIAMLLQRPIFIALFVGPESPFQDLAFRIDPDGRGRAVCSSSGKMGHSLSFGSCDLAAVFSRSASLADAAATALCNSISSADDLERKLEAALEIDGVEGAVAVYKDKLGRVGDVPPIVRHGDPELTSKFG